MNSQLPRIIAILEKEGRIDNFQAIEKKLTLRLGARVYDLRKLGWDFITERHGKNYIYVVKSKPAPKQLTI
jgi:hypothetical protein